MGSHRAEGFDSLHSKEQKQGPCVILSASRSASKKSARKVRRRKEFAEEVRCSKENEARGKSEREEKIKKEKNRSLEHFQ